MEDFQIQLSPLISKGSVPAQVTPGAQGSLMVPVLPSGANMRQAPLRVMIVDDAHWVRERFSQMLHENQALEIVGQAADTTQALRIFPTAQPDVMLLDLRLPDGSGLRVLQKLRESGSTCQVMMLTSDPYPFCRERCLAAGADYFFDKSEEFEQVVEELTRLSVNR